MFFFKNTLYKFSALRASKKCLMNKRCFLFKGGFLQGLLLICMLILFLTSIYEKNKREIIVINMSETCTPHPLHAASHCIIFVVFSWPGLHTTHSFAQFLPRVANRFARTILCHININIHDSKYWLCVVLRKIAKCFKPMTKWYTYY